MSPALESITKLESTYHGSTRQRDINMLVEGLETQGCEVWITRGGKEDVCTDTTSKEKKGSLLNIQQQTTIILGEWNEGSD